MSAPSQGRTITNVRTLVGPASAAAVADREVVRVRSSREDECTCDADCGDGNACTIDTCEFDGTDWVCVAVDADSGTICDDEGLAGDNLFCLAGGCDGAGTCVADNGPTPCNTGFTCNETEDRCESDECQGGDTCDDGEFCNGVESCNAENLCDSPGNPCFATGATCDEELDVCESPVNTGRCCYGVNNVEFCDEDVTKATCDGNGGVWDVFDTCPCPVYQSTHAPAGQVGVYNFGLDVTEQPCVRFAVVGDDYSAVNATQYVLVETFSFVGGVECTGDGGMTIEFYDDSTEPPTFVARSTTDFTCPDDGGANSWILTFTTPFYLPPTGFVTFAPGVGETVTLLTTDQALIGTNNDALLWVNDEDDSSFLSPEDPDVLAFELGGTQVPDVPEGACCNQTTGACEAKVEWICEADGGTWFDTIGQVDVCDPDPCTTGACCFAADVCVDTYTLGADCTTAGGTWLGYGSDCNPSCCETVADVGGDTCDAAVASAITINVPPLFGPDGVPDTGDEVATYHFVTGQHRCDVRSRGRLQPAERRRDRRPWLVPRLQSGRRPDGRFRLCEGHG